MKLGKDIGTRVIEHFQDVECVYNILENLNGPSEELERTIRCILFLSDADYDSLKYWVNIANSDRRDVFYFAEYDNRNERKWNFNNPFDEQHEYQYR